MFYSETILSRRGPLGKVWLAAHMERKLSKTQTLQTDIEQSVDAIMGQEIEVMALRLSGQLLLGVVRIYSRKAKYLLDDCNEALLKIKMAFRPGIVDMTEDQLAVNKNAITLQPGGLDLDLLLPDVNWDLDFEDRPLQPQGHHQAHVDDITLRTADEYGQLDLADGFDIGPSDGIGSHDFNAVDLGINWGNEPLSSSSQVGEHDAMSVDESIGVGRDAGHRPGSVDGQFTMRNSLDNFSLKGPSRPASEEPFAIDVDMDLPDFGGMDLGDLGIGFEPIPIPEQEGTPGQTRSSSRASSPLTEVPITPPPLEEPVIEGAYGPAEVLKAKKKVREKKQIIDPVTELAQGPGGRRSRNNALNTQTTADVSDILAEQHFLPRSSMVLRLLEIRDDPLSHFLPVKNTPNGNFFCAAPPGLAPELAMMFMRPISGTSAAKRRDNTPGKNTYKRPRLDDGDDPDLEQARRVISPMPEQVHGSDMFEPDSGFDIPEQPPLEDFNLEAADLVPQDADVHPTGRARSTSMVPSELTRLSTPPLDVAIEDTEESYADAACPIAMFDTRSATQNSEPDGDVSHSEGKGYSKNTVMALGLIRRELQPTGGTSQEKVMSFRGMAYKASRRAAASFFFELLVLGTRDCIHVTQAAPFENIEIRGKDKLWEQQHSEPPSATQHSVSP
ncbi:hypothetical protein BDN72DRAFT_841510 [Pluteus cervinus]|uniref:Uncharacterized protein n=1 Tax=Pluteus cervinus TaxID=181527 RepID=A0ACD3ASY7_9AGAR|nr:hypothetical protein BDN72DRAFT_841510 [Pluteus cervinus]